MTSVILIDWLEAILRWSAPLIICSIGEVYAERSGIINMGIEGIMLCGALCGVAVCYYANSQVAALLACLVLGAVLGLVVAFLTVSRRTNQVVTGLMVNMLATGGTEIVFSICTTGLDVITGASLSKRLGRLHPAALAYALHSPHGRASFDQTAAYYAVLPDSPLFARSGPGWMGVLQNGANTWRFAENGRHTYFTKARPTEQVAEEIDGWMMK